MSIDKARHEVTIDGKEVKGFMEAMTMPYPVKDDAALGRLQAGDSITATIVVGDGGARLEDIQVVKHAAR